MYGKKPMSPKKEVMKEKPLPAFLKKKGAKKGK
jgi:hypothetical protein